MPAGRRKTGSGCGSGGRRGTTARGARAAAVGPGRADHTTMAAHDDDGGVSWRWRSSCPGRVATAAAEDNDPARVTRTVTR